MTGTANSAGKGRDDPGRAGGTHLAGQSQPLYLDESREVPPDTPGVPSPRPDLGVLVTAAASPEGAPPSCPLRPTGGTLAPSQAV
jgi:hypothetical protein